jgi:hypothetical protein
MDNEVDLEAQLERLVLRMEALEVFKDVTNQERRYIDALIDLEKKHVRALLAIREQIHLCIGNASNSPIDQDPLSPSTFRT